MKAPAVCSAVAVAGLLIGGCSATGAPQPTTTAAPGAASAEAGGGDRLVLRAGTDDFPGRPAADQLEEFARQVAQLSEGSITVEPVWQAAGTESYRPDWDQQIARLVSSGELELALVPSRAWDTEGVQTLRPLSAPFLIDSHELLATVLTSDLGPQMMAGLTDAGVVGLAIFPEGLRHPFAFDSALLGPQDYEGAHLRVPTSATVQSMFEAWGATTDDTAPDRSVHTGMESAFVLQPGGVATANVTFFPKANVLVVNDDVLTGLDEGHRDILRHAAANTLEETVASFPDEIALAEEFCSAGGVAVHADAEDIAALEEAARPVLEDIRSATTDNAAVLDRIEELKAQLPQVEPAPACGEQPETASTGEESQLNGVYRFEVTEELMLQAWPQTPSSQISNNVGTWTISLNDGQVYLHGADSFEVIEERGTYRVDGQRVAFVFGDSTTPEVVDWERADDGTLSFTIVNVPDVFRFVYSLPWALVPELVPWEER